MTVSLKSTLALALALLLGAMLPAVAQNTRTVRGKVADEAGEPLMGAAVLLQGTTRGAVTDIDGNYSIQVPAGEVKLEASFIGYLTRTFRIGPSQAVLNIVLEPDVNLMDEVVVTAFATQKKVNVTGAISSVGGSAYDAPMVLVKAGNGPWTPYNIGRDVQGSITHVATLDGSLREVYYYDPWGSVVPMDSDYNSVDTLAVSFPGGTSLYSKIIGSHGYTGHEVIAGLGLINANARLYDPVTGRFLAPDPLIQDPASTQNFNRYSYCLNNPLKYTDESGEYFIIDSYLD